MKFLLNDSVHLIRFNYSQACNQNISSFSMDTNFADWSNSDATSSNHDFPFDFNNALNLKSTSPFEHDSEEQENAIESPFDSASNGFNSIIGNNNISNHQLYHHNGAYNQNDFLMNFYVSPLTITNTNYPLTATTNHPSSSYNPFQYHHHEVHDADVNSNNDNWATFNSDNFADFDTHFANMAPGAQTAESDEADHSEDQVEHATETCFVATTQTVEISTAPPEPVKREFMIGSVVGPIDFKQVLEELEDDEFFSLRDDSNDMSSLTDDIDKKMLENTEVPDDEDDDFASADER